MADLLPQNFPTPAESSITSYNWTDVASGAGYQRFYGFHTKDSSSEQKQLSTESLDSENPKTQVLADTTPAYNKDIDYDYDISFNTPRDIYGNILINATLEVNAVGGGGNRSSAYTVITAYKVVGGVETSLGTVTSATMTTGGSTVTAFRLSQKIAVAKTHFATLRFTVEVWTEGTGGSCNVVMWHDASARQTTTANNSYGFKESTDLLFQVPFKINL
jgi:hypothetical protein